MKKIFAAVVFVSILSCETSHRGVNNYNHQSTDYPLDSSLIIVDLDTTMRYFDGSGDGVFGRKIVYMDLSAMKAAITVSGRVVTKVCINRAGMVTYVELINSETTIRDKETLKLYLKAARGYKFQPDLTAPIEQCGKLSFKVDNRINNKLN